MNWRFVSALATALLLLAGITAPASGGAGPPQTSIRNPILPVDAAGVDSPDPWIFRHDGRYWINYTSDGRLVYRSAPRLDRLGSAPERRIWPPEGTPEPADRSRELWAPETHRINGRWYVYYTASGPGELGQHRMYVLESMGSGPAGPYTFKGQLSLPEPFAIDGTILRLDGHIYMLYSGGPTFAPTSIELVELENPWTVKGLPLTISSPEYGWEKNGFRINEGPQVLKHGKWLHIVYSASWCGTGMYALGRLTVPVTADPLAPATWAGSKFPDPVFTGDPDRGVYGPGHGSFFTRNDGRESWNVYHATDEAGKGCFTGGVRTTRAQRFGWNRDGTPSFGRPVSLSRDIPAPAGDRTIAFQAESAGFGGSKRATRIGDRRLHGYAGRNLTPAGEDGILPAMRFRLPRGGMYRLYLRVLGSPAGDAITLLRPRGSHSTRNRSEKNGGPVELDMGRIRLVKGRRHLRLRSQAPVVLDQVRLQPLRSKARKRR